MQPKIELYDKDGYVRLAYLPNCTNVQVSQDLDGQYELTFDYYYKDERYQELIKGRIVRLVEDTGPVHSVTGPATASSFPIRYFSSSSYLSLAQADWNSYSLGDYVWVHEDFNSTISTYNTGSLSGGSNISFDVNDATGIAAGEWLRIDGLNHDSVDTAENFCVRSISGTTITTDLGNNYLSGASVTGPVRAHCARVLAKWSSGATYYLGLSRLHFDDVSTIKRVNWKTFRVHNISESRDSISVTCKHIGYDLQKYLLAKHGSYEVSYGAQGQGIVEEPQGSLYEYLYRILSYNQINFNDYDDWSPVNGMQSFIPGDVLNFEYDGGTVSATDVNLNWNAPSNNKSEWSYVGPYTKVYIDGQSEEYRGLFNTGATTIKLDSNPGALTTKNYLIRGITSYTSQSITTGTIDVTEDDTEITGNNTALYDEIINNGMVLKAQDDYHGYITTSYMIDAVNYDDTITVTEGLRRSTGTGLSYELKQDRRPVSFSNDNLLSALQKVCDVFNDDYHKVWVQVNEDLTVDIRCKLRPDPLNPTSSYTIQYAHNLENVTRQHEDIDYYNRIIPQGATSGWSNAESGELYSLSTSKNKEELRLASSNSTTPKWASSGNGYLRYGDPLAIYRSPTTYSIESVIDDYNFKMSTAINPADVINCLMFIEAGTGKGQVGRIVGVDDDTVTVLQKFDTRPSDDSSVRIAQNKNNETLYAHVEGFGKHTFDFGPNYGILYSTYTGTDDNETNTLEDTNINLVDEGLLPDMIIYNLTDDSAYASHADVLTTVDNDHVNIDSWSEDPSNDNNFDTGDEYIVQGKNYFEVDVYQGDSATSTGLVENVAHVKYRGHAKSSSSGTIIIDSDGNDLESHGVLYGDIVYDLHDTGKKTGYYAWGVVDSIQNGDATWDQINLVNNAVDGDDNDFSDHDYIVVDEELSIMNKYAGGMLDVVQGSGKSQSFTIEHNDDLRFYVDRDIPILPDTTTKFRVIAAPRILTVDTPVPAGGDPISTLCLSKRYRSDFWINLAGTSADDDTVGYYILTGDDNQFEYVQISSQAEWSGTTTADNGSTGSTLVANDSIFTEDMVGQLVQNTTDNEYRRITAYTDADRVTVHHAINDTWDGDTIQVMVTGITLASSIDNPGSFDETMLVKEHDLPVSLPDSLDFIPQAEDEVVLLLKENNRPLTIGKHLRFRARILAAGKTNCIYVRTDEADIFEAGQLIFVGAKAIVTDYEINTWRGDQINGETYEIDYVSEAMADNNNNPIGLDNWAETTEALYTAEGATIDFSTIHIKGQFTTTPQPGDWIEVLSIQDFSSLVQDGTVERPISYDTTNPLELYDLALSDLYKHTEQSYKYSVNYIDKEQELKLGTTVQIVDTELGIDVNDQYISKLSYNPYNRLETSLDITNPPWYTLSGTINTMDSRIYALENAFSTKHNRCIYWSNGQCIIGKLLCEGSKGNQDGKTLSNGLPITLTECNKYKPSDKNSLGGDTAQVKVEEVEVTLTTSNEGYGNAAEVPVISSFLLSPASKAIRTDFFYISDSSTPVNIEGSVEIEREAESVVNGTITDSGLDWFEDTGITSDKLEPGMIVHNITDGSYAGIVHVEGNVIYHSSLLGGDNDEWSASDDYEVLLEHEQIVPYLDGHGCTIKAWYTSEAGGSLSENAIMRITVLMFGGR